MNFIAFVIWPLYYELFALFPLLADLGESILLNQLYWFEKCKDERSLDAQAEDIMRNQMQKQRKDLDELKASRAMEA